MDGISTSIAAGGIMRNTNTNSYKNIQKAKSETAEETRKVARKSENGL